MNAADIARRIAECFEEDGIPYAIGGAIALGVWGAPRATVDVDISVFLPRAELVRVIGSLERAGTMVDRAAAARDVERIGLLKGRLGRTIVDIFISEHPQFDDMRERRRAVADSSGKVSYFISVEDLCLHKLIYGRDKDAVDLERLIAANPGLDLQYVRGWLGKIVPAGDRRFALLDDLERRFARSI